MIINLKQFQTIFLFLFMFGLNFEVFDLTGSKFSISKFTGFFYVVSILPKYQYFFYLKGIKKFIIPLFLVYGINVIMSIGYNNNPIDFQNLYLTFFLNIVFSIILINHERIDPGILERSLMYFAMGAILTMILYFAGFGITFKGGRLRIFGDNSNIIAIRSSIAIIILIFYAIRELNNHRFKAIIALITTPILLIFMLETGSRKAIIALVLSLGLIIFMLRTRTFKTKIYLWIIGVFVGFFAFRIIAQKELLVNRLIGFLEEEDYGGRDVIWESLIPIIEMNPLLGLGKTGYEDLTNSIFGTYRSPHNVLIEILVYSGFIGLIIFLMYLFNIFKVSWKNYLLRGELMPFLLLIPIAALLLGGQMLSIKFAWVILAFNASREYYVN